MDFKTILRQVKQPAQYINNEAGSIHKDHNSVDITCCLCFPDKYEIGMSNLGVELLYFRGNELKEAVVERCYTPDLDMAKLLQENKFPLCSLETKKPLKDFDLVGFSLQYELHYSNVLFMLDLAGIPVLTKDRGEQDPLVFIGGPCAFNPEPLADFIDVALVGDGEFLFEEFLQFLAIPEIKKLSREKKLQELLDWGRDGVYITKFRNETKKNIVQDLDVLPVEKKSLIPYIDTVHNRCTVEIMRGCIHGCRFCQAGFTWRPLRARSKENILKEIEYSLNLTGHNEVSLLSLTATDHPQIEDIMIELNQKYAGGKVNISLPSIRSETVSERLLAEIQKVRKSTLTIAPEAGSQRLRDVVHKEMTEENILTAARIAIQGGTRSLKLYFMIGLPTETDEDILAIPILAEKILHSIPGKKDFTITISVSTFVPKPHTPFQWSAVLDFPETKRRQDLIKHNLKTRRIQFRYHDARTSLLEAIMSRGGREMGKVILSAYNLGARFDAWQECFQYETWLKALEENGLAVTDLLKEIPLETELPWDIIKVGVPKEYLKKEYLKALG